jgi:hypothetical protein
MAGNLQAGNAMLNWKLKPKANFQPVITTNTKWVFIPAASRFEPPTGITPADMLTKTLPTEPRRAQIKGSENVIFITDHVLPVTTSRQIMHGQL